jgi:hypothetical protein
MTAEPDDATIDAVGLVTEALEKTERARGHLYAFHQLTGEADFKLGDGVARLREIGHVELANQLERDLVGRNVIEDRWTFQIVEDYDDSYWSAFRSWEQRLRTELTGGRRHLHEAVLKRERRTEGHADHTLGPGAREGV